MNIFRLLTLVLITQHFRQVIHAYQCIWMLFYQHRLLWPKRLSMHLFRLLVLALTTQHIRRIVYAPQYQDALEHCLP
jgi:hypothetical protein